MQQCLGSGCMAAACIAVGMFISSLTESQVISAVLTFVALFAGYMMGSICNLVSESGNLLTKILGCYDFYTPLDNFMNGTLDVAGNCLLRNDHWITFVLDRSVRSETPLEHQLKKNIDRCIFNGNDHCNGGSDCCCEPVRGRTSGNMDLH